MAEIPYALREAIENGRLLPFVGAGVSIAVHDKQTAQPLFPSWLQLLEASADWLEKAKRQVWATRVRAYLAADADAEPDYLEAAKQAKKGLGNDWVKFLQQTLPRRFDQVDPNSLAVARRVWGLGSGLVVTTNYDRVLEWACPRPMDCVQWDIEAPAEMLATLQGSRQRDTVWHLHGIDSNVADVILAPDGYTGLYEDQDQEHRHKAALETFRNLILQRTLLFIGSGGSDTHVLRQFLSQAAKFDGLSGTHFALLKKGAASGFKDGDLPIDIVEFEDYGEPLEKLLEALGQCVRVERAAPAAVGPAPQPAASEFPDVGDLPHLDASRIRSRFIGRSLQLNDLASDLEGLGALKIAGEFERPHLTWVYGFGGMGKSWFLRSVYLRAGTAGVTPALIDWQEPVWCHPSGIPPRDPRDVIDAIAFRLAQIYGTKPLATYWQTRKKVEEAWPRRQQLYYTLTEAFEHLTLTGTQWSQALQTAHRSEIDGPVNPDLKSGLQHLQSILRQKGYWSDDNQELCDRARSLRNQLHLYDVADTEEAETVFSAWYGLMDSNDWVVRPLWNLARALQADIRMLCRQSPLLLIFDTYEIIWPECDGWIRAILSPLMDGSTPLAVLIGGRFRIDWYVHQGEPWGWRQKVGSGRMRVIHFDEDLRFTVEEVRAILADVKPPVEDAPWLADAIVRVTLGVPIALAMLLQIHEESPDERVLEGVLDLDIGAAEDPSRHSAVESVIGAVAKRFMHYLEKPLYAADLKAIRQLGLMLRPLPSVLAVVWGEGKVRPTFQRLSRRHEVMTDGDLHVTVRMFLHLHWMTEPFEGLPEMAQTMRLALEGVKPPESLIEQQWATWALERLNLLAWELGQDAIPYFAHDLVLFLAHEHDVYPLLERVQRIEAQSPKSKEALRRLRPERWQGYFISTDDLRWISHYVTEWTPIGEACMDLLKGLHDAEEGRHRESFTKLNRAVEFFGDSLPGSFRVIQHMLRSISELGQITTNEEFARLAAEYAVQYGIVEDGVWNHEYYWSLHNSRQYDVAEKYCRRVVQEIPREGLAYWALGHVLGIHMGQYAEAEQVFRDGLQACEDDPNIRFELGLLLETHLKRPEEALEEYRRILPEIDGAVDLARFHVTIGKLLASRLNRRDEAIQAAYSAIAEVETLSRTSMASARAFNNVAGLMYELALEPDRAERFARSAFEISKGETGRWTLSALLVRKQRWAEAETHLREYYRVTHSESFIRGWGDDLTMVTEAIGSGKAEWLAGTLNPDDKVQGVFKVALLKKAGVAVEIPVQQEKAVAELLAQFDHPTLDAEFPQCSFLA